jgi:hypothetical protein
VLQRVPRFVSPCCLIVQRNLIVRNLTPGRLRNNVVAKSGSAGMAEIATSTWVLEHSVARELPALVSGKEFREHTRRPLFRPRCEDLKRMERLLDDYAIAVKEHRQLCAVHEHGVAAVRELHEEYVEQLDLRDFQRQYCVEQARWEPGLELERQALKRLQGLAAVGPVQAQMLRQAVRTFLHREEVLLDRAESFEPLHLIRQQETLLEVLERVEKVPAGRSAIADLKRAERLLRENAAAGEWLEQTAEIGQRLPTLAQMQEALAATEGQVKQMADRLEKKKHHLVHHSQHIESQFHSTTAKLAEVCECFHKLRSEHFDDLVGRHQDGFLLQMQAAVTHAEQLVARRAQASTALRFVASAEGF